MDLSEDENNILNEIQRLIASMTSNNITHADIYDYNKSKHQIISNSRNLFILLSILKNKSDLTNQVVLEILNIIFNLISINQTSYNLEQVLAELLQIKIDDIALIQTLGKIVSFISELLFISEQKFVLPINDDKNSITPLEAYVFEEFLNNFSIRCIQYPTQFKDIEEIFKASIIPTFINYGIRLLFVQPLPAVVILRASLSFGIDPSKPILKKTSIRGALKCFQPPEIFQCLAQISTTGPEEEALDSLSVVTILARICDNWDISSNPIIENIQKFIFSVLENPAILNDQARAIGIQNFLIYVKPESKAHPFDHVIEFLFQFCQNVLQNFPLLLTIIYPGILTFFRAFKGNFSRPNFFAEFREKMKPCLIQYIDILLNSFEVNTQQTVESILEIKDNISQVIQSLKRLLVFSDLNSIHLYIKERTLQVINDDITVVNSFKISFILIVLNTCYIELDFFKPEYKSVLFDLLFELLPLIETKLPQYSQLANSTTTNFYLADFLLQVITTFLHEIFIHPTQSRMFKHFAQFCQNSNQVVIIYSIFKFLLFMILNGFEPRLTSIVMMDILNEKKLCQQLALETDLPNFFIENYQVLPCKFIYYFTLIKLVYADPQKSDNFLQNLKIHLTQLIATQNDEKDQSENLSRFFKIISTFFDSSLKSDEWFDFLQYIYTNFGEFIEKISESIYSKYVLKFISKLTETKDGEMHLPQNINSFPSTSPFSFQIFNFFCSLLTKILKNTEVKQLSIDESIFVSSIQTSDIYLSNIELFNEIDDNDWVLFSKSIRAMNCFMISPIPNFSIMKYYNDTCLLDFFNVLIIQVSKTTPVSLLSVPYAFDPLLAFIRLFTKYYYQIILETEHFLDFILITTKIAFLSNSLNTLENSCFILGTICREITLSNIIPLKQIFKQHYVLALNLLTIPPIADESSKSSESATIQTENDINDQEIEVEFDTRDDLHFVKKKASKFIYWFLCNDLDFAKNLIDQILSGINNEVIKVAIDVALKKLVNGAAFCGNKQDKLQFDDVINEFCIIASQCSFRLDYIPSMTQFFMFK